MSTTMMFANGNLKLALLFTAVLSLSACSGGGGGGGTTQAAPAGGSTDQTGGTDTSGDGGGDGTTTPTTPEPQQPEDIQTTADLQVEDDFIFSTSFNITLDVDVSGRISDNAHLVVCRASGTDTASPDINYSDCMIRTDLNSGMFGGRLKLTSDTTELAAALWFYDESRDPEVHTWAKADNAESFVIR